MRRLVVIIGVAALMAVPVFMLTIYDFLAVSHPVNANLLVVEGWIWNSRAIREASEEFKHGQYTLLVTVGGPTESNEGTPVQKDSATLAAKQLKELGVDEKLIVVLVVPQVSLHRTYASALILKNWLARSSPPITSINVFTAGAHARKSLVLFTRALGPTIKVGVIAGTDETYDSRYWWMSARGIYVIMRKTLGYLYAVFWPLPDNMPVSSESVHPPIGMKAGPDGPDRLVQHKVCAFSCGVSGAVSNGTAIPHQPQTRFVVA